MILVRVSVPNPDELLNSSGFGAGAKVRLEYSTDAVTFTEDSTQTIVTATTLYTFYHSAGTTSTYYRTRYSNTGGTSFSEYSDVFQVTTAPIDYATLASVKNRLNITDTNDDSIIETIVDEVNAWLELEIGFSVGPTASSQRLFDGSAVRFRDGVPYISCYPFGVRTVTAVTTYDGTGGTATVQTASDVLVRPRDYEGEVGWPGFELWVKDNTTTGWTWATTGYDVNAVTATWGWAVVPPTLRSIATRLAIAAFRARGAGSGRTFAVGEDIAGLAAEQLSLGDWRTIDKFNALQFANR